MSKTVSLFGVAVAVLVLFSFGSVGLVSASPGFQTSTPTVVPTPINPPVTVPVNTVVTVPVLWGTAAMILYVALVVFVVYGIYRALTGLSGV